MSDPHAHGAGSSEKKSNPLLLLFGVLGLLVFLLFFYFNRELVGVFTKILYFIEFICIVAIGFMLHKLWYFMKLFAKTGGAIVHDYESKLKHHHEHNDKNVDIKGRYKLALDYLNSENEVEWQIGIVELDNFIRLSLLSLGYVGETTIELIDDAKTKGLKHADAAEDVAYMRKKLKSKTIKFNLDRKEIDQLLEKFLVFKKSVLPENHAANNHEHDEHH